MWYNEGIEIALHDVQASEGCMSKQETHLMRKYTLEQQIAIFWNKVTITADDNKCWLWTGAVDSKGYGNKKWDGCFEKAHRVAWMIPNYVIPDGMYICHSCDTRQCCNPKHLFLGTQKDNIHDMIKKGRQAIGDKVANKGESHPNHKVTDSQVKQIRQRYAAGGISQKELAEEFGLGKSMIGYIVNYKFWKHIP